MNFHFPVFLDLSGKTCLVAGEGPETAQKVRALVDSAAEVTYFNPTADARIGALAAAGLIRWEKRTWEPDDLRGAFLVIAGLDDNAELFRMAEARNVLCNSVDDPEHCRFSFGATHRRGDLTIAISTNGAAPAVAVRLKEKFEREIGPEYGEFVELLKAARPEVAAQMGAFERRRELWYRIVDSEALAMLRRGEKDQATRLVRELMAEAGVILKEPR